jgi:hypothetical protein
MLVAFKSNSLIVENIFVDKSTTGQILLSTDMEYGGVIGKGFTVGVGVLNKE